MTSLTLVSSVNISVSIPFLESCSFIVSFIADNNTSGTSEVSTGVFKLHPVKNMPRLIIDTDTVFKRKSTVFCTTFLVLSYFDHNKIETSKEVSIRYIVYT